MTQLSRASARDAQPHPRATARAYTGRFFRPPFSLCPCPHDGPPCVCVVSPAGVPAVSVASAAWPAATSGRQESALATPPATELLAATPPPAKRRRRGTSVHASHNSVRVPVAPSSHCPLSDAPHASAATGPVAWRGG